MLNELIKGDHINEAMQQAIQEIHLKGPRNPITFEKLAYIKKFHPAIFSQYEKKLLSVMGLFYKTTEPVSMLEEVYSIYSDSIAHETGRDFTPLQASAYREINNNKYFSFSAPTSAGKSFLFREMIQESKGDIIIVVPSRALIAEYYIEIINLVDKSVLVLQFIEDINQENINRRIFIITPERGSELFKYSAIFNVELFLLDEAQISEEHVRGMTFDSFVRRIDKAFPKSKKIFAHPYIENPIAQLLKHGFDIESAARVYNLHTVGKIFISYEDNKFKYFSPSTECEPVSLDLDIAAEVLANGGTLLIYISKAKIYDGRCILEFGKYIALCKKVIDEKAIAIIEKLRLFIGAAKGEIDKHSVLIDLMEQGIVVHHGSMPLKARLLVEEFIKLNFARLCFATSTLNQGINMPFDVVWIDNFHNMKTLLLKNLIGRSGRTSTIENFFDYGYTIIKDENTTTFTQRFNETVKISESSALDNNFEDVDDDLKDIVEAIRNESFNDELHLTETQVARIDAAEIETDILFILDNLLVNNAPITGKAYYDLKQSTRASIKSSFKNIYIQHLRRSELTPAESSILSAAIPILLWHIQGKAFSEIVSLRHAYLSEKDKRRVILAQLKRKEITAEEARQKISEIPIKYTQIPAPIPNKLLRRAPLYRGRATVDIIDYDTIVYDTYDYLDKVISLSLVDPICAAFEIYFQKHDDNRANSLKNYIRFGTNDEIDIWLIRYGFGFEDIDWLKEYIVHVDSSKITFSDSIHQLHDDKKAIIERYL